MLTTIQDSVRTLIIPLHGRNLLLPNVAVAEVVPYMRPRDIDDAPDWLVGAISWRGLNIPLVSFDRLFGQKASDVEGQTRIAVINTVLPDSGLKFYALVTAGIPHLKRVNADILNELAGESARGILSQVQVDDVSAMIPNLAELESTVAGFWNKVA